MSDAPRWYLYRHKQGGLGTSLIPPADYANVEQYEVTGPFSNGEIADRFMEIHSANCKAKQAAKAETEHLGGTDPADG
jgi:hypothetical protein